MEVGSSEKMQRAASTEGERQKASSKAESSARVPVNAPHTGYLWREELHMLFLPKI